MKTVLMMAITLDGKIGRDDKHLADWTSPEDKKLFVQETKKHGVLIMGRKTYDTIGKPLPGRLNIILTRNPDERQSVSDTLEYTNQSPTDLLNNLKTRGYSSAVIAGGSSVNNLFLENNLIDEFLITIEPKIFGEGLSLFNQATDLNLELIETMRLNDHTWAFRYKLQK